MSDKKKKSFKEEHGKTRVGMFLQEKFPDILKKLITAGGELATGDFLGAAKAIIENEKFENSEDKAHAIKLIDLDIEQNREITKRWEADAKSNYWLPQNVRPITLIYLLVILTVLALLDGIENSFKLKESWIDLFKTLAVTVVNGYFLLREAGKFVDKRFK